MWNRRAFPSGLIFIALSCAVISFVFSGPAIAQDGQSCVTNSCHSDMTKDKVVHPPVKQGNLVMTLVQQGADLCAMCHESKGTKKVVHAPVMAGDCLSCHDPHQSPRQGMLKTAVPALCFQCHEESMMKQPHMHPPAAAGDCSSCHDNHQSDYPGRLVQEGNALCFMCHPDKEEGLKTRKFSHFPTKASCVQCHSPHGSSSPALLTAPVPDLCANCHPNQAAMGRRAATKHAPMADQKSCRNCHDPHFSNQPKLLITAQMALCLACHNRELMTATGRIANMKELLEKNQDTHGPLQASDCVSCHDPHGSEYWRILVKYYPSEFYTSYSDGKYALCFSCHDKAAFTEQYTTTATGFRNGDRNLHFVHVNKLAKGRTCRACHEVHADSGKAHHTKPTVQFSGWAMPMNYVPVKDGGSCAPGCHGEKQYSR
jgi:predicted CXXCH cytochrome family protein